MNCERRTRLSSVPISRARWRAMLCDEPLSIEAIEPQSLGERVLDVLDVIADMLHTLDQRAGAATLAAALVAIDIGWIEDPDEREHEFECRSHEIGDLLGLA